MAINPLQLPSSPVINSNADFSALERLAYNLAQHREAKAQNDDSYRQAQTWGPDDGSRPPPQEAGLLTSLGRRMGLIPEAAQPAPQAAPQAAPQTYQPAGAPRFDNNTDLTANHANAIATIETGGKRDPASYRKLGPVTESGDRAYGLYQVMGKNIPEWTKAALGRSMTPDEFLNNEAAQEAVFKHRFGGYVQKYGPTNAAKAWFGGEKGMNNPAAKDILGTTVASYADKFNRNAGLPPEVAGGRSVAPRVYNPGEATPFETGEFKQPEERSAAWEATPRVPAGLQRPQEEARVYNPGEVTPFETGEFRNEMPATDVSAQSRSVAPAARAVENLVSPQSASSAGITREQIAQMYRNPATRPLATAFLQKQFDPGTWTYHQVGDKLVGTNSKTGQTKVVMEDTKPIIAGNNIVVRDANDPSGYRFVAPPSTATIHQKEDETIYIPDGKGNYKTIAPNSTKAERELAGRTYQADKIGLTGQKREFYLANGRVPTKDEEIPAGDRREIDKRQASINSGEAALNSLREAKRLSAKAFSGLGSGMLGPIGSNILPKDLGGEAGNATQLLKNEALRGALSQLKQVFTGSQSEKESAMLLELQGSINETDKVRQDIYDRAILLAEEHIKRQQADQEAIRNRTMYKPGGPKGAKPKEAEPEKPSISWSVVK